MIGTGWTLVRWKKKPPAANATTITAAAATAATKASFIGRATGRRNGSLMSPSAGCAFGARITRL